MAKVARHLDLQAKDTRASRWIRGGGSPLQSLPNYGTRRKKTKKAEKVSCFRHRCSLLFSHFFLQENVYENSQVIFSPQAWACWYNILRMSRTWVKGRQWSRAKTRRKRFIRYSSLVHDDFTLSFWSPCAVSQARAEQFHPTGRFIRWRRSRTFSRHCNCIRGVERKWYLRFCRCFLK